MDGIGWGPFALLLIFITLPLLSGFYKSYLRRKAAKKLFLEAVLNGGLSLNGVNYKQEKKGFRRSNSQERVFKRRYFFDLLEIYDHSCANCNRSKIKLECDHFFIPKSRGGNLMMKHVDGYWVSNAILLCRRCNSLKADKSIDIFFEEKTLESVVDKNTLVSFLLNDLDFKKYL
ncbi:MAG: HNH endonuclease [Bacteriovoracaceae bacterium]|nr:HNH endonuclease [Bacteriovoracaceae bacterium]